MRCGIVKASELAKANRWDVEYWLGDKEILNDKEVQKAKQNLKSAKTKLSTAKKRKQQEVDRIKDLEKSGKVKIIKS
jgi:hypothetical protein